MKTKIIITINAEFGSENQVERAITTLNLQMKAWKQFYNMTHKKNKIEYTIEGTDNL
ncbi:MAG TPA: hypothetical protein VF941_11905 [Clostridia bacterium]